MREYKFRAWDEASHEMICHECFEFDKFTNTPDQFEVMQYTGLKDKHGVEIYESDIIVVHDITGDFPPEAVSFTNGAFYAGRDFLGALLDTIEVIGNIYENPELLGGTDDTPRV